MKVVFIDAYNLIHRARFNFTDGNYHIVYNFFRGLRPLIDKFKPDKVYFVLEGHPQYRLNLYPEYKANRKEGLTPEKLIEIEDFKRQRDIILELIKHFPFKTVLHPELECDDVIANLVHYQHQDDDCIVISNDTDYIQLYKTNSKVSIYSPVKKDYLLPVEYDYVAWKALVGDSSDNIKGVPRIGKKTAESILSSDINIWMEDNPEKAKIYNRNVELIRFADLSGRLDEIKEIKSEVNFEKIKEKFIEMEFVSMTSIDAWQKFEKTFLSCKG